MKALATPTVRRMLCAAVVCGFAAGGTGSAWAQTADDDAGKSYLELLVERADGLLQGADRNPEQAARLLQEAVAVGDAQAMITLAGLYRSGDGVEQDPERARALLESALAAGAARQAWVGLAELYRADGLLPDPTREFEALENAVELGDQDSMIRLANLIAAGADAPADVERAEGLLARAVSLGQPGAARAWSSLGDLYGSSAANAEPAKVIDAYEQAVSLGHVPAMLNLARYLTAGDTPTDYARARTLLEAAIEQTSGGDSQAWAILGDVYRDADEANRDPAKAVEAYERAAELGDNASLTKLVRMLGWGEGVPAEAGRARDLLEGAIAADPEANVWAWHMLGDLLRDSPEPDGDAAGAVEAYQQAADRGDTDAMVKLAEIVGLGRGVPVDFDRAVATLETAIAAGGDRVSSAWRMLGDVYLKAAGEQRDPERAAAAYGEAVELGDPWAMVSLAQMLIEDDGVPVDYPAARTLLEQAIAAVGDRTAWPWSVLGDVYRDAPPPDRDPTAAVDAYQQAADLGDQGAMIKLARIVGSGDGVPVDFGRAAAALEKAAGLGGDGATGAWWTLGQLYRQAAPGDRDLTKAAAAYREAIDRDDPWSMISLAEMSVAGEGVPVDYEQAKTLLERAIVLVGDSNAWPWTVLGRLYRDAPEPYGDPALAVDAYQKAADLGNQSAMVDLARIVGAGEGVPVDFDRATALLETAAGLGGDGAANAWRTLAELYRFGPPDHRDPGKAVSAFRQAADRDDPWAMISLAEMLIAGEGGTVDHQEARALLDRAIALGAKDNPWAWTLLANSYRDAEPGQRDLVKAADAYQRAGDLGSQGAMLTLARMLAEGDGIAADRARIKTALARAVEIGGDQTGEAWADLGDLYRADGGSSRDLATALAYYDLAATAGVGRAHLAVAQIRSARDASSEGEDRAAIARHFRAAAKSVAPDTIAKAMFDLNPTLLYTVLQVLLDDAGYEPGVIDGVLGGRSKSAINRFCADNGIGDCGDGYITVSLLEGLLSHQN